MSTTIQHFEEIDISKPIEEYYDAALELNNLSITMDLNFESAILTPEMAARINSFIAKAPEINKQNHSAIVADITNGDTVADYLEHHLDLIDEAEVQELIKAEAKTLSPVKQLLSVVHLKRIGIYPENEDYFAIFDYTIGENVTNYLIVLAIKENGDVDYITMES